MRTFVLCAATIILAPTVSAAETTPSTALGKCEEAAIEFAALVDTSTAAALASRFYPKIADHPEYFETWLRVIVRELGLPTAIAIDNTIDADDYTAIAVAAPGVEPPTKDFKFQTTFHHEGPGLLLMRLGLIGEKCRLVELSFGLPRSRSDALRRHYEINQQISAELAATSR